MKKILNKKGMDYIIRNIDQLRINLTKELYDYSALNTSNKAGFTNSELQILISSFPEIDKEDFKNKLGDTYITKDHSEILWLHYDVCIALLSLGIITIKQ